ncbi:peptidase, S24 family [Legionella geestiana]|uniref:Peptidase, S24 family n=1 Tax=Legionella geestiana TaxID=45065 RepID=A0A0W0U2N9_9GAMM|nr:helix-turn-helix domain-containing protein [Legionella geestiana]KTD02398.1 peptidase, S24 family [Legionella geestiana]STX53144.1 peptidase, S24 family [Legionella geestiana]
MNNLALQKGVPNSLVIAGNIKKLMVANNLSDAQLARAIGVSIMTIRRVTSGETEDPRISTLNLIASYFKISVDSLLENNERPIQLTQNNKPKFIPVLDWETIEKIDENKKNDYSQWDKWYPLIQNDNLNLNDMAFALESKPSMQPRFPKGTLFIINPNESIIDNDLVLVQLKTSKAISLREIVIDPPQWILRSIISGSDPIYFNSDEHDIIGVVVLTVYHSR